MIVVTLLRTVQLIGIKTTSNRRFCPKYYYKSERLASPKGTYCGKRLYASIPFPGFGDIRCSPSTGRACTALLRTTVPTATAFLTVSGFPLWRALLRTSRMRLSGETSIVAQVARMELLLCLTSNTAGRFGSDTSPGVKPDVALYRC